MSQTVAVLTITLDDKGVVALKQSFDRDVVKDSWGIVSRGMLSMAECIINIRVYGRLHHEMTSAVEVQENNFPKSS